jgi:EpsI family protein
MWLFTRFFSKERSLTKVFGIDMPKDVPADTEIKPREFPLSLGASLALLLISAATVAVVDTRAEVIPDRASFATFPEQISGWTGRQGIIEDKYLEVLQLDDYVNINYINKDGGTVNFYTAYYSSQRAGVSAHSPRACIPGGGWKIQDLTQKRIDDVANTGDDLFVNRLVIKKGDYTQLVYYWFQQRGRNITNEYAVKWYLLWDALIRSRTDGALVRLTTGVHPGEDIRLADERIIDFIKQVEPLMDNYVPR